jgi:AraC-like DNA-binding protein
MYDYVMAPPLPIAGFLVLQVGWAAPEHQHPQAELLVITKGAIAVEICGRTHLAEAGDMLLYPPGARHRERNAGRRPLELFYVHGSLDPTPGGRFTDRQGRISLLLRWLIEDRAVGAPAEALAAWMRAIRAQVQRCATGADGGVAERLRAGMRGRLQRPHGVEELARSIGLGSRQLLRRYRTETGSTPMADLRRLRCEAAADLLVSTDWRLERIAQEVGFCDAFHLSKVFRSHYGIPPGRMRRWGNAPRPPSV